MQKKLIELATEGEIVFKERVVFDRFRELFPDYNTSLLERAIALRSNRDEYFGIFKEGHGEAFELAKDFVTATEEMILSYVSKHPKSSEFEIASQNAPTRI